MVVFYNLVTFAMQENIEQQYAITFSVKLNTSATEIFDSLTKTYGDASLSRTVVYNWHKAFKEGRENVQSLLMEDQSRQQMIKMWKWCEL